MTIQELYDALGEAIKDGFEECEPQINLTNVALDELHSNVIVEDVICLEEQGGQKKTAEFIAF